MSFQIIRNDITNVKADVIVNTANPKPVIGSGTDSAIYRAAGEAALLAERRKIGPIVPGQAAATPAFHLSAKYIIHTVGPAWIDGNHGERDVLRSCYAQSLGLAAELAAESIAFPLIATGVYGFPKDEALNIALSEIGKFLLTHDMEIILVVFDHRAFELSRELVGEIDAYIDDHGVRLARADEYGEFGTAFDSRGMLPFRQDADDETEARTFPGVARRWQAQRERAQARRRARREDRASAPAASPLAVQEDAIPDTLPAPAMPAPLPGIAGKTLDEVLKDTGKSFQQKLFELIDESGLDDVSVYKKANIDRKVFSRIRCKADYRPKKKTAVAFAIALKLDMPTMLDLLSRAEIAFSPSNKFDLIITYFVTNGNYDIFEINAALFKYDQPILGD